MNYFFGFDNRLASEIDWFFNLNHLFLIAFIAAFVVACCFLLTAKSEKGKKITRLTLAAILLVLEIGRIIYKYLSYKHNVGSAEGFNWWWTISFQMCAIMTWTTIVTLVLSAFLKKDNKFLQIMYNILFGCAMIGGILTFCYPDCLDKNFPFLHFINIQTVLVHSLLIFVPIYLIKTKEFKVEIKNIWKVCIGYVFIGCVAMSASLISGNNFAYSLKFNLIDLGLPFPWHLPVLLVILMSLAAIVYGSFEAVRYIKRRKNNTQVQKEQQPEKNKLGFATYVTSNVCAILGVLIMLGTASLIGNRKTWLGILCLLGLLYMIMLLIFAEKHKKYTTEKLDIENKAKHITLITLTTIFALPVGVLYLIRFVREQR